MYWKIFGICAACLTTFGFVPQAIKIYRTKSSQDVSLVTLLQFTVGVTFWAIYGFFLGDLIIILANIVTFTTLLVTLALYYKYR